MHLIFLYDVLDIVINSTNDFADIEKNILCQSSVSKKKSYISKKNVNIN